MWKRSLVEPLRHPQTKAVGTDISDRRPSCHISAPQKAEEQDRREGDPGGPGHDAGRVRRSLRIQRQYAVPLGTRLATAGRADTRLSSRDRARPEGSAEGFAGRVMRSTSTTKLMAVKRYRSNVLGLRLEQDAGGPRWCARPCVHRGRTCRMSPVSAGASS